METAEAACVCVCVCDVDSAHHLHFSHGSRTLPVPNTKHVEQHEEEEGREISVVTHTRAGMNTLLHPRDKNKAREPEIWL